MNWRRTRAVARKECLHVLRDPRSLLIALALPAILLLLFGYALSLDVDRIPTLIYDSDQTPSSRELIARFEGSRYFEVLGSTDNYLEIERRIDSGECLLAVIIPDNFSADLLRRKPAQVQLLIDGSDSNTASIAPRVCGRLDRQLLPLFAFGQADPSRGSRPGSAARGPAAGLVQQRTGIQELHRPGDSWR